MYYVLCKPELWGRLDWIHVFQYIIMIHFTINIQKWHTVGKSGAFGFKQLMAPWSRAPITELRARTFLTKHLPWWANMVACWFTFWFYNIHERRCLLDPAPIMSIVDHQTDHALSLHIFQTSDTLSQILTSIY